MKSNKPNVSCFDFIEKRFNDMDRRFDELKEELRVHRGVILDQMRHESQITREYIQHLDSKKLDKEEFEKWKKDNHC